MCKFLEHKVEEKMNTNLQIMIDYNMNYYSRHTVMKRSQILQFESCCFGKFL